MERGAQANSARWLEDAPTTDRLFALGAHADEVRRRPEQRFQPLDIGTGGGGQLLVSRAALDRCLPAWQVLVDRPAALQYTWHAGEVVDSLAVQFVRGTDAQPLEGVENVQACERDGIEAINLDRMPTSYRIKPPAAARPARRRAVFLGPLADLITQVVVKLGRERASADACAVGFENTDGRGKAPRPDAGAQAEPLHRRRRRRDVRVGAPVGVKQGAMGAFDEHHLSRGDGTVHDGYDLGHVGREALGIAEVLGRHALDVPSGVRDSIGANRPLAVDEEGEFRAELAGIT